MNRENRIVVLSRYPRLGDVKTRLVPPLTPEGALDLHTRLTKHTLRRALALTATGDASVEVRTDAASPRLTRDWLGRGFAARYQGEGHLGDRIRLAFSQSFVRRSRRVVVIGSDCPRLASSHLRDALSRLSAVDVVLGPADDGGYYLVALCHESAERSVPVLFDDVPWGTASVLDTTVAIAEKNRLTYALLETLPDVDRPEDLDDAEKVLAADDLPSEASVSVVIPTLEDAALVGAAVASALAGGASEVLVVDGGSRDATRSVATAAGARVLESAPGRARQMNAGAEEARGDILLFLHADTTLPPAAATLVRAALAEPGVVAGGFGFAVPTSARWARLLTLAGRWRARLTHHPHGDEGVFLAAGTFRDLGGYPDLPTMEDWELVARLKRLGRVVVLHEVAVTSARAWEEHGLARPTALNLAVIVAYRLGVDPSRLARWRGAIAPQTRMQPTREDGSA